MITNGKNIICSLLRVALLIIVMVAIHFSISNNRSHKKNQIELTMKQIYIHPKCNCTRGISYGPLNHSIKSTCPMADFRGPAQNVISFSFYGDTNTEYFPGIATNCELMPSLYPNWTVRVYHNLTSKDKRNMELMCQQVCKYPFLDECYVGDIKEQFANIEYKFGMLWRFLVLGDASVNMFAVRDLDSEIQQREVDAVNDWVASGKTWHVMRDHSQHRHYMLGGMWGAKNKNVTIMQDLCKKLINSSTGCYKQHDQGLLRSIVWPVAELDVVAHDSFQCMSYNNTKPWPTQRYNRSFVGSYKPLYMEEECPVACRPPDHKDWIYC